MSKVYRLTLYEEDIEELTRLGRHVFRVNKDTLSIWTKEQEIRLRFNTFESKEPKHEKERHIVSIQKTDDKRSRSIRLRRVGYRTLTSNVSPT